MDPLSIAIALAAKFVPDIIGHFAGSKAADVAGKVVEIAQTVTGTSDPVSAQAAILADPAKALEFQKAVMDNRLALDTLALEETKAYLGDTQSARDRDMAMIEKGYRNSRANTMLAMAGTVVIGILVLIVFQSPLDDYVKTTITLILGRALGYVDQGFNFEFGTTRSSGKKDDTISAMAGK